MTNAIVPAGSRAVTGDAADDTVNEFVTFTVGSQMFGIPILTVENVLQIGDVARVPLAPPAIKGAINVRGRIVTVIDVRVCLGLPAQKANGHDTYGVTVEHRHHLYTLLVDTVGDVVSLAPGLYESNPSTLDPLWRACAAGVYRTPDRLMVVLDVERLLAFE